MKKFLIAANWKMHPPPAGWDAPESPYRPREDVDILVFAPFLFLRDLVSEGIRTGAQCAHPKPSGPHTGCVSITMLKEIGCEAVLCGHSERRREECEFDVFVIEQARAAIACGLHPIVCIGETLEERESGRAQEVVLRQMQGLPHGVTIAYEPVWAIGTGKTATPYQAGELHHFIRANLPPEMRKTTRILYGGSLNAENAAELLYQPAIDGGLIGGASLKPEEFSAIVDAAAES